MDFYPPAPITRVKLESTVMCGGRFTNKRKKDSFAVFYFSISRNKQTRAFQVISMMRLA